METKTRIITRVELFSGQAMQGLLAKHSVSMDDKTMARHAVKYATSLVAELDKEKEIKNEPVVKELPNHKVDIVFSCDDPIEVSGTGGKGKK